MKRTPRSARLVAGVLAVAALLAGCSTAPEIDTGDGSAMTYDGLYPVSGSRADQAWARPGVDWSAYSAVQFDGVDIEYRPGGETRRGASSQPTSGPFEVSDAQKARLQQMVDEALREELAAGTKLKLVDRPGPGTLRVRAELLDVVSWVPPDSAMSARDTVYLSEVGAATLVLEIRDSVSNAIFARVVDRRAAESIGRLHESSRVANTAEVQSVVNSWARSLRMRLEEASSRQGGDESP